jgi:TadE-like protein
MKSKRITRSRLRGAAMVETVVVLPVMIIFFGLLQYTRLSYAARIDVQSASHRETKRIGIRGCHEKPGVSAGRLTGSSCSKASGSADVGLLSVKSDKTATVAVSKYARKVTSHSYFFCNSDGDGLGGAEAASRSINAGSSPSAAGGCD